MAEEQQPDDRSIKQRFIDADLASIRAPLAGSGYGDFSYMFRSNTQATLVALEEVELWFRDLAAAEHAKADATRSITRKRALRSAAERYHGLADEIYALRGA